MRYRCDQASWSTPPLDDDQRTRPAIHHGLLCTNGFRISFIKGSSCGFKDMKARWLVKVTQRRLTTGIAALFVELPVSGASMGAFASASEWVPDWNTKE